MECQCLLIGLHYHHKKGGSMRYSNHLLTLVFFCLFLQSLNAQSSPGFIADILAEMEYVQGQILQLAEAMPEDKYSWRPAEGVRSVGEVFMHIGVGDYFSLSYVGGSLP